MDNIKIERKGTNGFETIEVDSTEAVTILNNDLKNNMTIWIDGKPFMNEFIEESDIITTKKEICVTNKLVGG